MLNASGTLYRRSCPSLCMCVDSARGGTIAPQRKSAGHRRQHQWCCHHRIWHRHDRHHRMCRRHRNALLFPSCCACVCLPRSILCSHLPRPSFSLSALSSLSSFSSSYASPAPSYSYCPHRLHHQHRQKRKRRKNTNRS